MSCYLSQENKNHMKLRCISRKSSRRVSYMVSRSVGRSVCNTWLGHADRSRSRPGGKHGLHAGHLGRRHSGNQRKLSKQIVCSCATRNVYTNSLSNPHVDAKLEAYTADISYLAEHLDWSHKDDSHSYRSVSSISPTRFSFTCSISGCGPYRVLTY